MGLATCPVLQSITCCLSIILPILLPLKQSLYKKNPSANHIQQLGSISVMSTIAKMNIKIISTITVAMKSITIAKYLLINSILLNQLNVLITNNFFFLQGVIFIFVEYYSLCVRISIIFKSLICLAKSNGERLALFLFLHSIGL